ncbi:T9SS type A sorting domain-containing protein [Flavobacterium sp. J27]|uniref:T9SS type A sorting domain-containing protein n=1 Tax=Flavobacterium sp. J27 TaxID=2060419 RepID=UPI0010320A10|nr:T9SS type A sorting domain-containing protein [Flavobacterium sp. J27]
MKQILLILFTIFTFSMQAQTTYTYNGIGDWTDQANWSPSYPGTVLAATDEIIITVGSEVEVVYYTINGKLTNRGKITSNSFFTINGSMINIGTFQSNSFFTNNGTLTNLGTFRSNSFFDNLGTFNNEGTLINNSFGTNIGTINNTGVFTISTSFYNNNIILNDGSIVINSTLSGNNISHSNNFNLTNGLSPGESSSLKLGTYVFDADLFFENNAKLYIDINSTENDLVAVSNVATLNGRLDVTLLDDYDPVIDSEFTILTANTITGTFSALNFPDLGSDKEFVIIYNPTSVVLKVVDSTTLYAGNFNSEDSNLILYPNPTTDGVSIIGITQPEKVVIYSTLGVKVATFTVDQINNTITISHLKEGTYFLTIGNNKQKLIKR